MSEGLKRRVNQLEREEAPDTGSRMVEGAREAVRRALCERKTPQEIQALEERWEKEAEEDRRYGPAQRHTKEEITALVLLFRPASEPSGFGPPAPMTQKVIDTDPVLAGLFTKERMKTDRWLRRQYVEAGLKRDLADD